MARRLHLLVAVLVLALGAVPAGAAPEGAAGGKPVTLEFVDQGSVTIDACAFPTQVDWDLVHRFRYFLDREGQQWQGHHHIKGTYRFTNLDTGYVLEGREANLARAYDYVFDLTYDEQGRETGTVTWTRSNQGSYVPLNVPGEGRVLYDVGRLTFRITARFAEGRYLGRTLVPLTESGRWSGWGLGDLCPYLG